METYTASFYHHHLETNRTMRMDIGGVCQYCARKAQQRVELFSPLWQAGPIMYGECCLPLAEAALKQSASAQAPAAKIEFVPAGPTVFLRPTSPHTSSQSPRPLWITAAVTAGLASLALGLRQLLASGIF